LTTEHWLDLISASCVSLNMGLLVYNWLTMRQYYRLREMLLEIVVEAYTIRRMAPIWRLFPDFPDKTIKNRGTDNTLGRPTCR
jgi:hypothetical protein